MNRAIRRPRPTATVVAMALGLGAISAVAWARGWTASGQPLAPRFPWLLLAVLFAVVEATVFHVQVRREAQAVSLNEIPLILALFLTSPAQMLTAAILGAAVVFIGYRRQSVLKVVFNCAVRVFGVTLALSLFHLLGGSSQGLGPMSWLAGLGAVVAVGLVDALLILTAVAVHEGDLQIRGMGREMLSTPFICAVVGAVGLLAVAALHADPRNAVLLMVVGTALFAGYRAHALLHDRHVSLARLYDFGRAVNDAHQIDDVLTSVLAGARDLLKAEAAELVLAAPRSGEQPHRWVLPQGSGELREGSSSPSAAGRYGDLPGRLPTEVDGEVEGPEVAPSWLWHTVLAGGGPLLLPRQRARRRPRTQLDALGYREAVVVPIMDEDGILGTLMVAERMGQVRTFHQPDVTLLETVANQAGLALNNSRLMQRLRHDAMHDVLTGLGNRARFNEALHLALEGIETGDTPGLAIMVLDLDGFKEVNDSFGHHHGDALLVHVARQLTTTTSTLFGQNATVARLGGDEFAILITGTTSPDTAVAVAGLIQQAIADHIVIDDVEVAVRASIGITLAPAHSHEPTTLLRYADEAMYSAKTSGGGTRIHTPHSPTGSPTGSPGQNRTDSSGKTALALLADLRHAIEEQQIGIHVQPQAYTPTGQVYGAEALVRWNHPTRGPLPPSEFVSLAERHGLMHDLTMTVLDQAIQAAAEWRAAALEMSISVNLSARSLSDHRLQPAIIAALRRHQLPHRHLTLEITEDSIIDDPERAITQLNALRATGIRLSVDDFGTGYSSLSYLQRLPVTEVKIDRSFVTTLIDDPDNQVIVRAITDLGTNLGLTVIAEGVEDQPTWDHLTGLGCHAIQGYHLAKPMPPDQFCTWLQNHQHTPPAATPVPASRTPTH